MAGSLDVVLRRMGALSASAPSDDALLARFVVDRDPAAFELLVWRHGGMVLSVCRRLLRQSADAEDAFQATFLILARKAGSIQHGAALVGWLHRVASRVATAARRRARRFGPPVEVAGPESDVDDLGPVLDEEVQRLPERYRLPVILCYLQGKSLEEAATVLGSSRGTVGTWLARARQRLRRRLELRGVAPVVAVGASLVAEPAPAALVRRTTELLAAEATASAVVVALTEEALNSMMLSRLKWAVPAVLLLAATGIGGMFLPASSADPPTPPVKLSDLTTSTWGTIADPDRDCKFVLDKGALVIELPGSDHALCIEQNRMNAPRVLRPVEGDFVAQVKVTSKMPAGATSVVASRRAFHGAGLLLFQDDRNYIRLEKATVVIDGENRHYTNWELRQEGAFARGGSLEDQALEGDDIYLRLERRDGKLYALVGFDGINWKTLQTIDVALAPKCQIGVVAGHNTSTGYAVRFADFRLFRDASAK